MFDFRLLKTGEDFVNNSQAPCFFTFGEAAQFFFARPVAPAVHHPEVDAVMLLVDLIERPPVEFHCRGGLRLMRILDRTVRDQMRRKFIGFASRLQMIAEAFTGGIRFPCCGRQDSRQQYRAAEERAAVGAGQRFAPELHRQQYLEAVAVMPEPFNREIPVRTGGNGNDRTIQCDPHRGRPARPTEFQCKFPGGNTRVELQLARRKFRFRKSSGHGHFQVLFPPDEFGWEIMVDPQSISRTSIECAAVPHRTLHPGADTAPEGVLRR